MKDLVDVPKKVREDLKIIPVQHMDQVLEIALAAKGTLRRLIPAAGRKRPLKPPKTRQRQPKR